MNELGRIQLLITMLEMKDFISTGQGITEIPSYNGEKRNELKEELFTLKNEIAKKQDQNKAEVEVKPEPKAKKLED